MPLSMTLEILHEDEACLAALKPAGLSTQAPRSHDSLELRVRELLRSRAEEEGRIMIEIYLGLPHRLDRPVSGAILFAKTRRAARVVSRQFERRQVRKIYWAIVEGAVNPPEGTWIDCLRKVPGQPRAKSSPPTRRMPSRPCSIIARSAHRGSKQARPQRGSKSRWKPAACIRREFKRPRAGIRSWAMRNPAHSIPSARKRPIRARGPSPCTRGASRFATARRTRR